MPRAATQVQPRKLPTQARALETVEAILAATKKVLVKEGYEGTTTNRVAETAGVSIGSLYQYFPSKDALLAELVDRHLKQMQRVLATTAAEGQAGTIEEAARTIIRAIFAAHRVSPKLHRVIMQQMARIGAIENLDAFESETQGMVEAFLTSHRTELRPKNVKIAARVAMLAVRGTTLWTVLRSPAQLDDQEFQDELTDMVIRYLVKGS
ncbi:MAG TPA: TetR/AcrR family transcriptional regulator [Polyangiaceae bacterium]